MQHQHEVTTAGTRPSPWYRPIDAVLAAEVRDFLFRPQRELPAWLLQDEAIAVVRRQVQAMDDAHHQVVEQPLVREALPYVGAARTLVEIAPSCGSRLLADGLVDAGSLERFVSIDRSAGPSTESAQMVSDRHPHLAVSGVAGDVTVALPLPRQLARPALFACLGGGINRLSTIHAVRVLRQLRAVMRADDRVVIGVDLRNAAALEAHELAQLALRETWHRHALTVLNRELQTNFESERFQYRPLYDAPNKRLTLSLEATTPCRVTGPSIGAIAFRGGDRLRTGVVCQYDRASLTPLMRGVGLTLDRWLEAPGGSHAVAIASAAQNDVGT